MTETAVPKAVQELLDKQALMDIVLAYFRACDRRDFELLRSCYHEDAVEDRGALFQGSRDEWVDWVAQTTPRFEFTIHHMFNAAFKVDGDYAEGEISAEAYHRTPPPDPMELIGQGRYFDRYERRDGVWKIIRRVSIADRGEHRKIDPEISTGPRPDVPGSRPGADDLSYREFSLFKRGER